jgi:hypothetical protein
MRLVVLTAIAVAMLVAPTRSADACSCYTPTVIAPADGASEVPTNAVIVVANRSYFDVGDPVLEGPYGPVEVELTAVYEVDERLELVTPLEPLAASTDYSFRIGSGPAIAFRTGTGTDVTPPEPAVVGPLAIAHAYGDPNDSCGDEYIDIQLPITLPADAVAAELVVLNGFERRTLHVVTAEIIDWPLGGQSGSCNRYLGLGPGDDVCFEVRSRDQAGNLAELVRRCTTVIACDDPAALGDDVPGCDPPPPMPSSESGCSAGSSPSGLGLLALLLLSGYAVRRSWPRYAVLRRER